jgi:hypothetical protein
MLITNPPKKNKQHILSFLIHKNREVYHHSNKNEYTKNLHNFIKLVLWLKQYENLCRQTREIFYFLYF